MKGSIKNIIRTFPYEWRVVPEQYAAVSSEFATFGIVMPEWSELTEFYDDVSEILIAMSHGEMLIEYDDVFIKCKFRPGFIYNNASTPKIVRSFIDNDSLKMKSGALPHDGLYGCHYDDFPKDVADKLFVDIIEYYNDQDEDDNFFENAAESIEEFAIETAFKTDAADEAWNAGAKQQTFNRLRFSCDIIEK